MGGWEIKCQNQRKKILLICDDIRAHSGVATVAKEIAKEAGSAAEFGKLNTIQQESLAASVGMTRNELAKLEMFSLSLEACSNSTSSSSC